MPGNKKAKFDDFLVSYYESHKLLKGLQMDLHLTLLTLPKPCYLDNLANADV